MPRRLCAKLYVEEGTCPCAPGTGPGSTVGTGAEFLHDGTQLAWSCAGGSYTGDGILCGSTTIDIDISFTTVGTDCYVMLTSSCLGYEQVGTGPDTRLKLVMSSDPYTNDKKKQSCLDFTFAFEIDMSSCDSDCTSAVLLIQPDSMECRGTPMERDSRPATIDECSYTRICATYTSPTGTGDPETKVCLTDGTGGRDNYWTASFLSGSLIATITQDGANFDQLTLTTTSDSPLTPTMTIADCQNNFKLTWELTSGATITVEGDQHTGCADCTCVCECLCVTRVNSTTGEATRTLACWNGTGTGTGESWSNGDLEVTMTCDYCNDVTEIILNIDPTATPFTLDCPDVDALISITTGDNPEDVTIACRKCTPCVIPATVIDDCGCASVPTTLTATIENVTDCACADAVATTLYYNFDSVSPQWYGLMPSVCGVSDLVVTLTCGGGTCGGNSGCDQYELTICGGEACADVPAGTGSCCSPFELLFQGLGGGCSVCNDPVTSDFNVRITE